MGHRPLGSTGERVSVIGLGGSFLDKYSLSQGVATVRRALDLGVTYFDTAPAYGRGASQVIVGRALEGRAEPYVLATKLGACLNTAESYRSTEVLWAQLHDNLRILRRSAVDILQVHVAEYAHWWQDGVPSMDAILDPDEAYDFANAPIMRVMRDAKAQGLCRFIGITADRAEELADIVRHVDVDVCLLARAYNLLYRHARESVMPLARERGIAYIAAGAFTPGLADVHPEWLAAPPAWLAPEMVSRMARLYDLQRACGLSLVTLAIRYLVADPTISTILVGAASPSELEESVAAAQAGPLPQDLHQAIEDLAAT
jgi:D-threo-aldose 1-dehydrogenase